MNFDLQGPANPQDGHGQVDIDEEENDAEPLPARMLREHHRLAHLPFTRMRAMARAGLLPRSFVECCTPICTTCLYRKSTKRLWRTKGDNMTGALKQATYPGQCVAVDQSESPVPGLVAQLKGIPTKKRYMCATVFVDWFSDFSYVHFQYTTNASKTLEAKHAFERFVESHGVTVRAYHVDNGCFAENLWQQDAQQKGQNFVLRQSECPLPEWKS